MSSVPGILDDTPMDKIEKGEFINILQVASFCILFCFVGLFSCWLIKIFVFSRMPKPATTSAVTIPTHIPATQMTGLTGNRAQSAVTSGIRKS